MSNQEYKAKRIALQELLMDRVSMSDPMVKKAVQIAWAKLNEIKLDI